MFFFFKKKGQTHILAYNRTIFREKKKMVGIVGIRGREVPKRIGRQQVFFFRWMEEVFTGTREIKEKGERGGKRGGGES